jgi:hypothetical protein
MNLVTLTLWLSTHERTHSLEISSDSLGDEPQPSYQGSTLVTNLSHQPSYFPLELLEIISIVDWREKRDE